MVELLTGCKVMKEVLDEVNGHVTNLLEDMKKLQTEGDIWLKTYPMD